ncbi:hypothetical protein BDK51DRAFT_51469 [Blyttiomyces helicus]|uniref:Uncharacterized protein n=1 Tax=Blyttiomyces helicus TaxID=388810 RepID=A0A4P9WLD2_9FUNG|nr:hypothetical protein BDK51DRAFT_51469 [Blyttiomyces helicus]|eukprot:RKO91930.1 hypothetical protein BDK51DRAFT_51469 [Blyttiomyces helicus]
MPLTIAANNVDPSSSIARAVSRMNLFLPSPHNAQLYDDMLSSQQGPDDTVFRLLSSQQSLSSTATTPASPSPLSLGAGLELSVGLVERAEAGFHIELTAFGGVAHLISENMLPWAIYINLGAHGKVNRLWHIYHEFPEEALQALLYWTPLPSSGRGKFGFSCYLSRTSTSLPSELRAQLRLSDQFYNFPRRPSKNTSTLSYGASRKHDSCTSSRTSPVRNRGPHNRPRLLRRARRPSASTPWQFCHEQGGQAAFGATSRPSSEIQNASSARSQAFPAVTSTLLGDSDRLPEGGGGTALRKCRVAPWQQRKKGPRAGCCQLQIECVALYIGRADSSQFPPALGVCEAGTVTGLPPLDIKPPASPRPPQGLRNIIGTTQRFPA